MLKRGKIMKRKIVNIDETKCNDCGSCILKCAEGDLQIINGKAKLVKDTYCDGLGACLGQCPQGAITMEEREATAFDETLTQEHLRRLGRVSQPQAARSAPGPVPAAPHRNAAAHAIPHACPGSMMRSLARPAAAPAFGEPQS